MNISGELPDGKHKDIEVDEEGHLKVTNMDLQFDENGNLKISQSTSLVPATYDYISISYTDGNATSIVYKSGGASGTTVSTLTLVYDGNNNLTSLTKS